MRRDRLDAADHLRRAGRGPVAHRARKMLGLGRSFGMKRSWRFSRKHCAICHAAKPTQRASRKRPRACAGNASMNRGALPCRSKRRRCTTKAMPLGNETGMTDEERAKLGAWISRRRNDRPRRGQRHERARNSSGPLAMLPSIRPGWRARPREQRPFAVAGCHDRGLCRRRSGSLRAKRKLALIRAHPDLATARQAHRRIPRASRQAPVSGPLERRGIRARSHHLNDATRRKFGFPFIFAVKGATKQQILASFAERVDNSARTTNSRPRWRGLPHLPLPHRGPGRAMTHTRRRGQTLTFGRRRSRRASMKSKARSSSAMTAASCGRAAGRLCRKPSAVPRRMTMATAWSCRASSMPISISRNTACSPHPGRICSTG